MNKFLKQMTVLVFAMFLVIGVAAFPASAAVPQMNKANVSWDLKKGKTVTCYTTFAGMKKLQKMKVKMTGYKVSKAPEKGYKQVVFSLKFTPAFAPNAQQVHTIANAGFKNAYAPLWYTVTDYETGRNLEGENKFDVKTEVVKDWAYKSDLLYEDEDGCWVSIPSASAVTVKVTYPKDYKGLCIGVGGKIAMEENKATTKFWKGKTSFVKTCLFSPKNKKVAHFIRVK